MAELHIRPDGTTVGLRDGETILDASLRSGVPHTHVCGGRARCSTCRVLVLEGLDRCPPRTERESRIAEQLNFGPEVRLACQIAPTGDVTVRRLVLDPVDTELADQLSARNAGEAAGRERPIAVLFSDLRDFTSFTEALLPYDVIHILNRFLYEMGQVIRTHDGTIASLTGDGLMAIFGVEDESGASDRAVAAAVEMQAKLDELNPYVESLYGRRLTMGVGVHYGKAVVGALGVGEERTMTAIGDTVNTASRVERATKDLDAAILITEQVYRRVSLDVHAVRHADVELPGKGDRHALYEIADRPADAVGDRV